MASNSKPTVLIVGRLSGPKNDVILKILRDVAPAVAKVIPHVLFKVIGGPVVEEHRTLAKANFTIRFEGHQKNLKPFYQKATVVIGAGRVALEAMALQRPVIAIGERMYVGPLGPENREAAKATNFGDCLEKEDFDWAKMTRDLVSLLKDGKRREKTAKAGLDLVKSDYDLKMVYPPLEALYQQVLLEKNLFSFNEIPVWMLHRVVKKEPAFTKFNLHLTQANLEEQLLFLKNRGFETITFGDLLTKRIPKKPILLTFDDGYEDNYHNLLPLLQKHKMKAVLYLLGNRKHKNNFWDIPKGEPEALLLKPAQIKEMDKSGLVEWGAHSMDHTKLTGLTPERIQKEVAGSKRVLEDFLGKPVVSFAYPYGFLNAEIKKITAAAGYTFAVAVNTGPTRFGEDLMEIRRIHIFPRTSLVENYKKTSGFYLRYRKWMGK